MISDTLSDAIASINEYQDARGTKDAYKGLKAEITNVKYVMESLRVVLDMPPTSNSKIGLRISNVFACLKRLDLKALKSAREALDKAVKKAHEAAQADAEVT